jgi:hypothetical protein
MKRLGLLVVVVLCGALLVGCPKKAVPPLSLYNNDSALRVSIDRALEQGSIAMTKLGTVVVWPFPGMELWVEPAARALDNSEATVSWKEATVSYQMGDPAWGGQTLVQSFEASSGRNDQSVVSQTNFSSVGSGIATLVAVAGLFDGPDVKYFPYWSPYAVQWWGGFPMAFAVGPGRGVFGKSMSTPANGKWLAITPTAECDRITVTAVFTAAEQEDISVSFLVQIDADGDGFPNWEEREAGTDPYDPDSFPGCCQETNNAPTADSQSVSTPFETPKAITLTGSDPDGDELEFWVMSDPIHGVLSYDPLTYTPNPDYHGPDSFTFLVNDGQVDSAEATVSITVGNPPTNPPTNRAPTADSRSVSTAFETAVSITLSGSDPDNDSLSFLVQANPTHGTLDKNGSNVVYNPNLGFSGQDMFTFKVNDGQVDSNVATVTVNVGSPTTNPNPTTVLISASVSSGSAPLEVVFAANTSYATGVPVVQYAWDINGQGYGSASMLIHTFTAAGSYVVRVRVTDSDGGSAENTVTITVT